MRVAPATYRRRRLAALAVLVTVIALLDVALDGREAPSGPPPSAEETRLAAFASDPAELTVSASGDLLIHSPVFYAAQGAAGGSEFDFRPMLAPLKPYVEEADLGICHFETPVSDAPPTGQPLFNAPAALASAVAATGWDVCDTASNHSLDGGQHGIDATRKTLARAGLEHTGSFDSRRARDEPLIVDVDGVRVGLVAYTTDTNGLPLPKRWSVNVTADPEPVIEDARAAREAGADVVLVNIHWASEMVPEYVHEPNDEQRRFARRLVAAPEITAVIGQGPHVVQPIEWMRGKPVVFGQGNLLANQGADVGLAPASQDGLVALLDIVVDGEGDRVERVSYVPVFVSKPSYAVLPVGDALESGEGDAESLRASYERTVAAVGSGPRTEPVPSRLPEAGTAPTP